MMSKGFELRFAKKKAEEDRALNYLQLLAKNGETDDEKMAAFTLLGAVQSGELEPTKAFGMIGKIHSGEAPPKIMQAFNRQKGLIGAYFDGMESIPKPTREDGGQTPLLAGEGATPAAAANAPPQMGGGVPMPGMTGDAASGFPTPPMGQTQMGGGTPPAALPAGTGEITPAPAAAPPTPAVPTAPTAAAGTPPPQYPGLTEQIELTDANYDWAHKQLDYRKARLNYLLSNAAPGMASQQHKETVAIEMNWIKELQNELSRLRQEGSGYRKSLATQRGQDRRQTASLTAARERTEDQMEQQRTLYGMGQAADAAREERRIGRENARDYYRTVQEMTKAGAAATKEQRKEAARKKEAFEKNEQRAWNTHAKVIRDIKGVDPFEGMTPGQKKQARYDMRKGTGVGIKPATGFTDEQAIRQNDSYVWDYVVSAFDVDPKVGDEVLTRLGRSDKLPQGMLTPMPETSGPRLERDSTIAGQPLIDVGDPNVLRKMIITAISGQRTKQGAPWTNDRKLWAYQHAIAAFALRRNDYLFSGRLNVFPGS